MDPASCFLTNMGSANWGLTHHMSNSLIPPANWDLTSIVSNQLELNCSSNWELIAHVPGNQ